MWQFSVFIGNRRKHKTTDIWRCANEDQCVTDKTGCSCRTITRSVRLARQGCWCCACRSSSPVLHESYCRITSWSCGDHETYCVAYNLTGVWRNTFQPLRPLRQFFDSGCVATFLPDTPHASHRSALHDSCCNVTNQKCNKPCGFRTNRTCDRTLMV